MLEVRQTEYNRFQVRDGHWTVPRILVERQRAVYKFFPSSNVSRVAISYRALYIGVY